MNKKPRWDKSREKEIEEKVEILFSSVNFSAQDLSILEITDLFHSIPFHQYLTNTNFYKKLNNLKSAHYQENEFQIHDS